MKKMKSIEECLDYLNNIRIYSERARNILERVSRDRNGGAYPNLKIGNDFWFVSGAIVFSEPVFMKGNYPGQRCDAGIYWTTNKGRVLGMLSFDILDDEFAIRQIQGTNSRYLEKQERAWVAGELPWEESLIMIVEDSAKDLEVPKVSIISASELKRERVQLKGKHFRARYDIPALYRGFHAEKDGYYRKRIDI